MTTIATDGHTMAGDTQCSDGHTRSFVKTKVCKVQGWLVGYAGTLAECVQVLDSMREKRMTPKQYAATYNIPQGVQLLCVDPDGKIYEFSHGAFIEQDAEYFALGTGDGVALGAMYMGASPYKAVQAAMEHNPSTGGKITIRRR